MKRFHVNLSVEDLAESIRFYAALIAAEPTVRKDDYAKWMLDDPRINLRLHNPKIALVLPTPRLDYCRYAPRVRQIRQTGRFGRPLVGRG